MREPIDFVAAAFLNLSDEPLDVTTEESTDAIGKLFEAAAFDSALGTPGAASALENQTAFITKRAGAFLRHEKTTAPDAEHTLAKRFIFQGKKAHRIEKSVNGLWSLEYDEDGELLRGYAE